ncbi:MAG: thiamine-phosphate kinase, partial [Chthoniobacterales bacterium]
MTLSELREDRLVHELIKNLHGHKNLVAGPGDDCAVIKETIQGNTRWTLLKTDVVVSGVHFLPAENPQRIGRKALCRAISDIAACGGTPKWALVTLLCPASTRLAFLKKIYRSLSKAATEFGVTIVGGETSRSDGPLSLSIALTGESRHRPVLRSGAKAKHTLFVTGVLGGSLAGHHLDFTPRLAEAAWLIEHFRPSAMMDLSDGLAQDLPRLCKASSLGVQLDLEKLPLRRPSNTAAALRDGEDYELLFTLPPTKTAALLRAWQKNF